MYSTTSAGIDAGALREQLMGAVTVPGDAGWDAARLAWTLNPTFPANTFTYRAGPKAKSIRMSTLEPTGSTP